MIKIGIGIRITNNGAGEPIVVNDGSWSRYISDVRQVLEKLSGMEDGQQVARMLSFTDDGCLITLMRLLNSGRGGDNVSAWIYIPAEADINGTEVITITKSVQDAIQAPELNKEPIELLGKMNYPKRSSFSKAPTGKALAVRYYNYVALMNILGSNRYQPYYDDYRYIFLLDEEGPIKIADGVTVDDISRQPLGKNLSLLPRSEDELRQHFGDDVKITLPDGTPFDHPIQVEEDERVTLQIERKGFNPVKYSVRQDGSENAPWKLPAPDSIKWTIDVVRSMFKVVDDQENPLPQSVSVAIKINGKTLGQKPIEMEEDDCQEVLVEVSAGNYYTTFTKSVNLTKEKPVKIQLERKAKDWTTKVMMSNKEVAQMTLTAKRFPNRNRCPLLGYDYNEELDRLEYDTLRDWFHRAQGFLAAIAVGLLCWGVTALYGKMTDKRDTNANSTELTEETVNQNDSNIINSSTEIDYQEAINYMEHNEQWRKDSLDVINNHALEGLYDDLNMYDFMSIKTNWASKLERSTRFQGILNIIKDCEKKGLSTINGPYSNDGTITIDKYLERIRKKADNKAASNPSGPHITTPVTTGVTTTTPTNNGEAETGGSIDNYEGGL